MIDHSKSLGSRANSGDNLSIPAGYTYVAQFINHDFLYKARMNEAPRSGAGLRKPRLNLDSLYGDDPRSQGSLYLTPETPSAFRLGATTSGRLFDLPRDERATAVIPEKRNDNNLLIAQFTVLMMRFHNALLQRSKLSFPEVRRIVTWHYQRIILEDFLPRLIGRPVLDDLLRNGARLYSNARRLFVPAEFANAAFRLHTMTRNRYQLNRQRYLELNQVLEFTGSTRPDVFPLHPSLIVDWDLFFPASSKLTDPQMNFSRLIDPYVAQALRNFRIPDDKGTTSRALRIPFGRPLTLLLTDVLSSNGTVPSAQALVSALRTKGYEIPVLSPKDIEGGPLVGLGSASFGIETPLFYYLLKEAQLLEDGKRMGPLGSRIVGETLFGVMAADTDSVIHQPTWTPMIRTSKPNTLEMSDIVRYVTA